MTAKTVMLYSVEFTFSGVLEMVSVEAEERPSTYRLQRREGAGFRYSQVIYKTDLIARGIASSKRLAIELFISKRNRKILRGHDAIARWEKQIRAADALLAEIEKRPKCQKN